MSRSHFGTIQYTGPDAYRVFWTDDGKRRSKRISGTRDDAEAFLASMMLERGAPSDMTWNAYWKSAVEPSFDGLADKTVHEYKRIWRVELEPRIGRKRVGETTWRGAEATLNDIRSASVQAHAMRLWRKMCNMAVRDGLLDRNPIDRTIKLKRHEKRRKALIEAEDMGAWLEAIRGLKYEAVFLMEVGGGLRHAEACAMVWENVTRYEAYGRTYVLVRVERDLVTVDGRKVLKDTKNVHSTREVVIGEPFASRLLELKQERGAVCAGSAPYSEGDYSPEHFASPTTMTHNWRAWCRRNGVEYVRPGDMRSVFATLHGEAGTPDSLVSMAMGHTDGTTKGRNYQQSTRRGMVVAADSLTEFLGQFAPLRAEI